MNIENKLIASIYNLGQRLTSVRRVLYENLDERERYLKSLPEPNTWLERSYLQYMCQYREYPVARLLLNLVCIPLVFALFAKALFDVVTINRESFNNESEKCIAVLDAEREIIPQTLIQKHGNPTCYPLRGRISFDRHVLELFFEALTKYWYEPHFLTKILLRLGRYSELIATTKCKVIVASAEYSFASSALTGLCEKMCIRHVNIMHGEKVINPVDAFCGFHEFFVWDDHYISIFSALRARVNEYTVAKPAILTALVSNNTQEIKYDFIYYLGWELSMADTISIKKSMEKLAETGRRVCIRMHPRYGDRAKIESLFKRFEIEDPDVVNVLNSLDATRAVIALSTTVFWHAEAFNRPIIIDDISNPDYYKKLSDIRYLWVSRPHTRLSELDNQFFGDSRSSVITC